MEQRNSIIPSFLVGGGEMGELTRAYNWADTAVGDVDKWPQSLSTTISIILHSRFPMFLWWGPELICFYNDAYRPSLGNEGKHPSILGMPAKEAWPEIWDIIKPLIDQVLAGGEATWNEDQLIPIYRNGRLEDVYWTFSYSPVRDESGGVGGVLVVCTETTEKVQTVQKIEEMNRQLNFAIDAAEMGTWDLNPQTFKFAGNKRLKEWFGLLPDDEIPLDKALNAIIEKDRKRVTDAISHALQYASSGNYDIEYTIVNAETCEQRTVKAKGKAVFDTNKMPVRFNGTLEDITKEKFASEQRQKLLTLVDNSVDLMSILQLDGRNGYINTAGRALLGIAMDADVSQIPIADFHTPEQLAFVNSEILPSVMTKGKWAGEFAIKNQQTGEIIPLYNNCHKIIDEQSGETIGVGAVMRDLRPEYSARKEQAENEARLNVAINATELGMWELNVKDGKLIYNKRYLEVLGFGENDNPTHEQIRKTLHPDDIAMRNEAVKQSMKTGLLDMEFRVVHPDASVHWIKAKGKVLFDENNLPEKQLGTVMDITEQKNAAEAFRLSSERFQMMADIMPQLVWTADPNGFVHYYNASMLEYSGLTMEELDNNGWLKLVHADDIDENMREWNRSITKGTDYLFQHRFRRYDGEYRWHLSRAVPQRDQHGNIKMWVGSSTDIHDQKTMSQALELKVQERTKALRESNEELEKMNNELASFAYVSSHDLQEPLRKIRTFISRIEDAEHFQPTDRIKDYFDRIKLSATRMQALINDLLSFSRTNTAEKEFVQVDMNALIAEVQRELSEQTRKSHAVIDVSPLQSLTVIAFQFRQLFTNLFTNAIKFAKKEQAPHIRITGRYLSPGELNIHHADPEKAYYHIAVSDNGIGFSEEYSQRIFEVFQRLHSKNEYEGTGIGLAICKKIVENHQGFISAESRLNEGATFHIYIPLH